MELIKHSLPMLIITLTPSSNCHFLRNKRPRERLASPVDMLAALLAGFPLNFHGKKRFLFATKLRRIHQNTSRNTFTTEWGKISLSSGMLQFFFPVQFGFVQRCLLRLVNVLFDTKISRLLFSPGRCIRTTVRP